MFNSNRLFRVLFSAAILALAVSSSRAAESWWNAQWTARKKFTIDTSGKGAVVGDPIGTTAVLVRLSDTNFNFAAAKEDGADLRFVAEDDKTLLMHHVERWDSQMAEALVWVKLPELKPASATSFWLYFGNSGDVPRTDDVKGTFDADTTLVYHFSENGAPPADSSATGATADKGGLPSQMAMIAGGVRLMGQAPITVAPNPALEWKEGGTLTISAWIKPISLRAKAVLLSRREGANALLIGEDNGVPFVEVTSAAGTQRTAAGTPLAVNAWKHLGVTFSAGVITLYLDGVSYGTLNAPLPAMNTPILIGKDGAPGPADQPGFAGEVDELQMAKVARPVGWFKFVSVNQGPSADANKLLVAGEDENAAHAEESELGKHLNLLKDISKDLTIDGWVVIVLCIILAVVGWLIAIGKVIYLNKISKASKVFLKQWEQISSDITALDHADQENVSAMGGVVSRKEQKLARQSPLFALYHIGSQEIQKRIDESKGDFKGLSGRSIETIRATLDGGHVREVQKLNGKLVFLTIGIAGGPYLGLLGTVIGVMITFAVIAKTGAVEVNSIAPGIAGALLATVAGLAVAIPALFAYSYLSSRIKEAVNNMEIFIDEFIARIAEAYPTANE